MKVTKLFIFALLGLASITASCGKGDKNQDGNIYTGSNCYASWATAVSQNITQMSEASQAYYNNQTVQNCNNLKAAYQNYVNALRPYKNCSALYGVEKQEFIESLDEYEEDIESLCD